MSVKCCKCGKELVNNVKSLNMKLYTLKEEKMLCISCLANFFGVKEKVMYDKIQQYKGLGCSLFD